MNINDLVITETKKGPRIHRATCKRQGEAAPLMKAVEFAPGTAALAKPASCCKPTGVEDAVAEYLGEVNEAALESARIASEGAKHFTPDREDEVDPWQDPNLANKGESEISQPLEPVTSEVIRYTHAKHFWKALGVYGGSLIAEASGEIEVEVNTKTHSLVLTGSRTTIQVTGQFILDAWSAANGALRAWKKVDPTYRSYPKKEKWGRDDAYTAEQTFLKDFCAGAAAFVAGTSTERPADGYRLGRSWAAGEDLEGLL